jgi:autotransporter strand-loop-strand O-heptosyltransferase
MVKISFVTHLPMREGSPRLENLSDSSYVVTLSDNDNRFSPINIVLPPKSVWTSPYQYYIHWKIEVWSQEDWSKHTLGEVSSPLWKYDLDLSGKVVFIKMDAHALGDNLAWMPYIQAFSQKHKCITICSTFWNDLFIQEYPEIMFVKPNTHIENVFAQYYIGTHDKTPPIYSPTTYITEPLQKVAADILGLEWKPLTAKVKHSPTKKIPKKVCLSEYASMDMKMWHGDWQKVVDTLVNNGYEVTVISKEPTTLKGVINKTGHFPIEDRVQDLASSTYFIGVSSGLSWLAHSLGCHVFLISDFTPKDHEFSENVTRIYGKGVREKIEYKPLQKEVSTQDVLYKISQVLHLSH